MHRSLPPGCMNAAATRWIACQAPASLAPPAAAGLFAPACRRRLPAQRQA